jgi:hypothetical protein
MTRVTTILGASGLVVLALSLPSWAQLTRTLPTQTVTLSGTVETIDTATGTSTAGPTTSSLCVGVMGGKVLQCSVDADK